MDYVIIITVVIVEVTIVNENCVVAVRIAV